MQDSNMSVEAHLIEVEVQEIAEVEAQEIAEVEVQEIAEVKVQEIAEVKVQEIAEVAVQEIAEVAVQEIAEVEVQEIAEIEVQEIAEDLSEAEINAVKLALPPVGSMKRLLLKRAQVMASATNKRLGKKHKLKAKKRKGQK
jgi:hypothetical protein